MKCWRILILLALVLGGIYLLNLIMYLLFWMPLERQNYETHVTKNLNRIEAAINQAVEYRLCIYEGPFPFSSRLNGKCKRCEDLHTAGLLAKSIEEYNEHGMKNYDVKFNLTEFGNSVYDKGDDSPIPKTGRPRFCFGKTKLHKILKAQSPIKVGRDIMVGIQYVIEVDDPHPFLFDPASKSLGLNVPKPGVPALYPPEITTSIFYPNGDMEFDSSFRYGEFEK